MKGKKVLVTGGAGFIGTYIVRALIERHYEVVVLDNLSVGRAENIPEACHFVQGDIRNVDDVSRAISGCSIVFHDAAFVSIRKSFDDAEEETTTNVLGTLNVLRAAVEHSVEKFVFASSNSVYGDPVDPIVKESDRLSPISPYGLSKRRGELYCDYFTKKYNLAAVSLRCFNVYGIGQTPSDYVGVITIFVRRALQGQPLIIYGDGKQTRDFVWVEDVASANIAALDVMEPGKHKAYNLASGRSISVLALAEMIRRMLPNVSFEFAPRQMGELQDITGDISKAKRELIFRPTEDIEGLLPGIVESIMKGGE